MDWLEIIAISGGSAIVSSGLVVAILRKFIFDQLDLHRRETEKTIDARARRQEARINEELSAYPELMSLCYHAKLIADECAEFNVLSSTKIEELREVTGHITEALVRYRLCVPPEIFSELHKFKHLSQNFLIYADVGSRLSSTTSDPKIVEEARQNLRATASNLSNHLNSLDAKLRSAIKVHT